MAVLYHAHDIIIPNVFKIGFGCVFAEENFIDCLFRLATNFFQAKPRTGSAIPDVVSFNGSEGLSAKQFARNCDFVM